MATPLSAMRIGPSDVASLVAASVGDRGIVMTKVCSPIEPGVCDCPVSWASYMAWLVPQYGVTWSGTPLERRTTLVAPTATETALL